MRELPGWALLTAGLVQAGCGLDENATSSSGATTSGAATSDAKALRPRA